MDFKVGEKTLRTMTVGQLIEKLSQFDAEMPVVRGLPAHDYVGRELAGGIRNAEVVDAWWCEYHRMFQVETSDIHLPEYEQSTVVLVLE